METSSHLTASSTIQFSLIRDLLENRLKSARVARVLRTHMDPESVSLGAIRANAPSSLSARFAQVRSESQQIVSTRLGAAHAFRLTIAIQRFHTLLPVAPKIFEAGCLLILDCGEHGRDFATRHGSQADERSRRRSIEECAHVYP
jgi:hypothetical protein